MFYNVEFKKEELKVNNFCVSASDNDSCKNIVSTYLKRHRLSNEVVIVSTVDDQSKISSILNGTTID